MVESISIPSDQGAYSQARSMPFVTASVLAAGNFSTTSINPAALEHSIADQWLIVGDNLCHIAEQNVGFIDYWYLCQVGWERIWQNMANRKPLIRCIDPACRAG